MGLKNTFLFLIILFLNNNLFAQASSTSVQDVSAIPMLSGGYVLATGDAWFFCGCSSNCGSFQAVCAHQASTIQCQQGFQPQAIVSPIYNPSSGSCATRGNMISEPPDIYPSGSGYYISFTTAYTDMLSCDNEPIELQWAIYCQP